MREDLIRLEICVKADVEGVVNTSFFVFANGDSIQLKDVDELNQLKTLVDSTLKKLEDDETFTK